MAATMRAELARRMLTQADLANHLRLSQAAVSRKLAGSVPFSVAELYESADWLGVPVGDLVPAHPGPSLPAVRATTRARKTQRLPRVDSNHQPAGCASFVRPTITYPRAHTINLWVMDVNARTGSARCTHGRRRLSAQAAHQPRSGYASTTYVGSQTTHPAGRGR